MNADAVPGLARADRAELIGHHPFPLDAFQLEAMDHLDGGASVLVAAPTGSGKTVVAEYAIAAALADGRRAFYTAPIKALSNQKFYDLGRVFGPERVGLLTGDNAINPGADVVVMTTEVLRNMIYGRSLALRRLQAVVLDEVHFLQDTYRGPVWEEVIIHLPPAVRLVCLSATVSNAAEVAEWVTTVRGPTMPVVEERRPVRLENLYMVGDRTSDRMHMFPTLVNGRPNPEAARLDEEGSVRSWRGDRHQRHRVRRKLYTPSRIDIVERLDREAMLPVIYFIFSRNACDEAARGAVAAGLRLTTPAQQARIREIVDARLDSIVAADLDVLGYGQFAAQLEVGVAAHHAGMVPPFKEAVEACFVEGLVKVVFATETLAVGINMPARSVVIEKLTKFTGDHHEALTAGEYTQLTGRAGRRGIDAIGHAVVPWSPFVTFEQVAALASSRTFRLTSAFRPTYNMAANLVRSYTSEEAHHLLNLSFAQYQADRDVVRLEARLDRRQGHLAELREGALSPYGDIHEYRASQQPEPAAPPRHAELVEVAIARLRPGDIVHVEKGRVTGRAVVLTSAYRKNGMKLSVLTPKRAQLNLAAGDFPEPPGVLGTLEMPEPYAPHRHDFQREVAARLARAKLAPRRTRSRRPADEPRSVSDPVEADPDLATRLKLAVQADRVAVEVEQLRQQVKGRSNSVARRFDKVLEVLEDRGYVDGWSLTDEGEMLARTFHECDLLVVECVRQGLLDGLGPAELAGLVSVFVYEHRSPEAPPAPWYPSRDVRRRFTDALAISRDLAQDETRLGLAVHRTPDPTFVAIAFAWAAGEGFAEVVEAEELSGGDFVRTTKQLIDLLRQLVIVAPDPATRECAQSAADALFRGVVAASSAVADI